MSMRAFFPSSELSFPTLRTTNMNAKEALTITEESAQTADIADAHIDVSKP